MKAMHAAMLLLACHSGNVIAAPAAHGNSLTFESKTERNAPPFKLTNNILDAHEPSFGTLRREQVEEKTGPETTTLGLHPEQCKAMVLANTMLTSAFEFLHRIPQAHDKHARDNIHPRDLLRREEAMHRADQQAAREAQGLGLDRNLVTTMFKTLSDAKHSTHPLHGNSSSSLSFVLKSFFDALKAFFAELKATEGSRQNRPGLPSGTQSTGLPTLSSQGSDLATPTPQGGSDLATSTPQGSGLPESEDPDNPELPPMDPISPEPIPFVEDPYGNNHYGGDHYGGDHYGGDHYGGDHYGGDHYGGDHYGGDYHSSDDTFGNDHYPGGDPFWNDPNESSSVSLSSGSIPTDVTTGVLPTGLPSGLIPTSLLPSSLVPSDLPTGLPSGPIPNSLLPSSLIPSDLPTELTSGLIPTSLLPSSLIPSDLPTGLPSGLIPTSLLP
ncbi:hypothetical protein E4U58_005695, partial [Claviceps cyperi]